MAVWKEPRPRGQEGVVSLFSAQETERKPDSWDRSQSRSSPLLAALDGFPYSSVQMFSWGGPGLQIGWGPSQQGNQPSPSHSLRALFSEGQKSTFPRRASPQQRLQKGPGDVSKPRQEVTRSRFNLEKCGRCIWG